MNSTQLEKQLAKVWKKLIKANIAHHTDEVCELQRKIIELEIEQKHHKQTDHHSH